MQCHQINVRMHGRVHAMHDHGETVANQERIDVGAVEDLR
jgi:hypothetical protein